MEKIYPDIIDIIDKKKNDEYFLDVRNKNNKKISSLWQIVNRVLIPHVCINHL